VCVEENVDMSVLLLMTESHLKLLKLPIGHRIRLMRWIGLLKRAVAVKPPNATAALGVVGPLMGTQPWTWRGVAKADLVELAVADVQNSSQPCQHTPTHTRCARLLARLPLLTLLKLRAWTCPRRTRSRICSWWVARRMTVGRILT
jgi:hypothetical protein